MSLKKIFYSIVAIGSVFFLINLPYNNASPVSKLFFSGSHSQADAFFNAELSSEDRASTHVQDPSSGLLAFLGNRNNSPISEQQSNAEKQNFSSRSKISFPVIGKNGRKKKASAEITTPNRNERDSAEEESADPQPLSIFFRKLPPAVINEPYCQYLDPLWGSPPYQWTLIRGSVPKGLNFDAVNGMLCGEAKTEGFYSFQAGIRDANKSFINVNYELFVLASSQNRTEADTLKILTEQLPSGFVGKDYFFQLSAAGGEPPYEWRAASLPNGLLFDFQTGVLYGVPLEPLSTSITIVLMDQAHNQITKNFPFVIETSPLFITTQELTLAEVGNAYYQKMTAHGGIPPYSWQVISGDIPQGLFFDTATGTFQGTPTVAQTSVLQIQVSDQEKKNDIVELSLTVSALSLKIQTDSLISGRVGQLYYAPFSASGGGPPYSWSLLAGTLPSGINLQPTGVLTGIPLEGLSSPITVEVKDQLGNADKVTVNLNIQDPFLEILTDNLPDATTGSIYSFRLSAQGGMPFYRWQIVGGQLPVGLTLSSDGLISGQPQLEQSTNINVRVTDASNSLAEKSYNLKTTKARLSIQTDEISTATFNEAYQFQLQVEGGVPPYTWIILAGYFPRDLSLQSSGLITGISKEIGMFPFDVQISDGVGQTAVKSLFIPVIKEPLKIVTSSLPGGQVGLEFNTTLLADGGMAPYAWSILTGGLPQGLKLNTTTGKISGTPTQAGILDVSFEVTDTLGKTAQRSFEVNIPGAPLTILTAALKNGTVNEQFNEILSARGGLPPYNWTITGGAFPNGISLNSQTGVISGLPTTAGVKAMTVQIADQHNNTEYKQLTIDVKNQPLTFITNNLTEGKVGVLYQFSLQVTGGTLPYQWAFTSGALPQGLQLNVQTGIILGTPTEAGEAFNLTVVVTDQGGETIQKSLTLKVYSADITPVKGFIARGSDNKIGLAWINPPSPRFDHVKIVRKLSSFPQSPDDGAQIYSGHGNNMVDRNLINGTNYYYSAFAYDQSGTHSSLDPDSSAAATPEKVQLSGQFDPFADEVVAFNPLNSSNYFGLPNSALGAPRGGGEFSGTLDVVSLQAKVNNNAGATPPYGGSITLRFSNNIVVNEPGVDFIVFENTFRIAGTDAYWIEPAIVDVSMDGVTYYRFPFDFVPHYNTDGTMDLSNPFTFARGFAGVKPALSNNLSPDPTNPAVAGGDAFDLDNLGQAVSWFQYIRITSTGDNWLIDSNGDAVRHSNQSPTWSASGSGNSGFDLDAVAAVHY